MNDRTAILLVRLEHSIQNDFRWLKELGEEHLFLIESAHLMTGIRGADPAWKEAVERRLAELDHLFQRTLTQLEIVHTAMNRKDRPAMIEALDAAESCLPSDFTLEEALAAVRVLAGDGMPELRRDWHTHEQMLKSELQRLRTVIHTLDTRLALLNSYTENDVDPMVRAALAAKPAAGESIAATQEYIDKYRQASLDIHHEQHEPGNIVDDIKAMFLWVDAPEERMDEKRRKKKPVVHQ